MNLFGEKLAKHAELGRLCSFYMRRSHHPMPTSPLLPLPDHLDITAVSQTQEGLQIRVTSNRPSSPCPLCSTPSDAIHSYYRRKPVELPCAGQPIRLLLSVRKFFCRVVTCPRKVFTERIPEFIQPSSRLTTRLRTLVQAICLAFNGNGGVRLGEQIGFHLSRKTLVRSLHLLPASPVESVRVVGIDDFAWKKGKRYGTIILDLETHTILDLLPDREAVSVKEWLVRHPEVEIVSRDRGGAYADGAAQGAPQAEQVADRWHLCKNLGDAVETALLRLRLRVPDRPASEKETPSAPSPSAPLETPSTEQKRRSQVKRVRKQEVADHIQTLHETGMSIHAIAAQMGIARNTVRRYLRMDGVLDVAPRPRCKTILDPHFEYLNTRWKQGETNAHHLFEELQTKGYRGSETTVRNFVARLRKDLPGMLHPPRRANSGSVTPCATSPRAIRWLLTKQDEELESEEHADRDRLLEHSSDAKMLHQLIQQFMQMIRERQADQLNAWMHVACTCDIKEMKSFAAGIERDYDAVKAGLTLEWSQGPVEGTINMLKMHKRLMYGRASFTLLHLKMLHQKGS